MKIISFILRLVGSLGVAYGVCVGIISIVLLLVGDITPNGKFLSIIFASFFGGIILKKIGNSIYKVDRTGVSSFKLSE